MYRFFCTVYNLRFCLKVIDYTRERIHGSLPDSWTKDFSSFSFQLFSVCGGWSALKTLHRDTILYLSEHVVLPLITLLQVATVNLFSNWLGRQSVKLPCRVATWLGFIIHVALAQWYLVLDAQ
jgi:hypothetical protein